MKRIGGVIISYLKRTDRILWILCLTASGLSLLLLLSIANAFDGGLRDVVMQAGAIGVGILCILILSSLDYHSYCNLYKLYVPLILLLIGLTFLVGYSPDAGADDKAWLLIPLSSRFRITIQPAEFMKIAFIMTFSLHLSRVREEMNYLPNLLLLCLHGAIPTLLVVLQGDDGTALIFFCIFVIMLFSAGVARRYIIAAFVALAVAIPILWFFVMNNDQKNRILVLFNPGSDPLGIEWQQTLGKISIGSGQLWGKGLFAAEYRNIPEMRNDMIFAFIGEALGFVGCIAVLALLLAICIRVLMVARQSMDSLGYFLCVGVFAMLASQIVINIGMCLVVMPVVGITLPFFSSGGSSVLTVYLGMSLVFSVQMNSNPNLFF